MGQPPHAMLPERLDALFAGRRDVWGAEWGQCIKRPLTLADWDEHINGDGSVGVYPLCEGDVVKWGCVDVDEGYDLINLAVNVCKGLRQLGITSWLERTRSKGFHCWVFTDDWVSAEQMRAALFVACALVDYRPKEVNPKAARLRPGFISNYVNVPWARKWAVQGRRVMVAFDDPRRYTLKLESWLDLAEASLTPPSVIAKAAALYKPPPPPRAVAIARPSADPTPRLRGVARRLYEDGPLPSLTTGRIDRSAALQRLAHLLRADGFSAGEAYHLVADLDSRLGKYVGRSDAALQYERIVSRAYS